MNDRVKHVAVILKDFSDALTAIRHSIGQFNDPAKKDFLAKVESI